MLKMFSLAFLRIEHTNIILNYALLFLRSPHYNLLILVIKYNVTIKSKR